MEPETLIKDIMTKNVISVNPSDTIAVVKELITQHQIHHMPVVENKKVIGMISMNDIHQMEHHFTVFNNPESLASNRQLFTSMLAKEIMTKPVVKVKENEPVSMAVDLLLENLFHALPVVNNNDEIVGMVTTFDLIRQSLEARL